MPNIKVRDVSLFVDVVGRGDPLLLMHGGPGADHWTLLPFKQLADRFTLVFYDHRCNGRSTGAPVSSMTWENLAADADALRAQLGFERWTVLGHSFGGHVALEYALRYPDRLSNLILMDTAAESRWSQQNAARVLQEWGFGRRKVELAKRWFNGEVEPSQTQFVLTLIRLGDAYEPHTNFLVAMRRIYAERRSRKRPKTYSFASRRLLPGWSVVDRLHEIDVPTLVMAGREDFVFPPESQRQLVDAIPNGQLHIVERAGHDPYAERTEEVMRVVEGFLTREVGRNPSSGGSLVDEPNRRAEQLVGSQASR
jgi:proline iminopeptidase